MTSFSHSCLLFSAVSSVCVSFEMHFAALHSKTGNFLLMLTTNSHLLMHSLWQKCMPEIAHSFSEPRQFCGNTGKSMAKCFKTEISGDNPGFWINDSQVNCVLDCTFVALIRATNWLSCFSQMCLNQVSFRADCPMSWFWTI